jgi:hypothetical protein
MVDEAAAISTDHFGHMACSCTLAPSWLAHLRLG